MLNRLKDLFRCLEEHEVRYVVIGGIAAVLHGVPRATFDLDLLIEATPQNARSLLEALLAAGLGTAARIDANGLLRNAITVFRDRVRVDVQTRSPGIEFAEVWPRREIMNFEGQRFAVLSRLDLMAAKRASGRPVDLEDLRLLELRRPESPP